MTILHDELNATGLADAIRQGLDPVDAVTQAIERTSATTAGFSCLAFDAPSTVRSPETVAPSWRKFPSSCT